MSSAPEIVTAYLALGGNVGDVEKTFSGVAGTLSSHLLTRNIRFSRLYKTAPWGVLDQNDFFNLVVELKWMGTLDELSAFCFSLEDQFGRDRMNETRWGPRPIDIDLLLFGDTTSEDSAIEIPHPRMHLRRFVLQPLSDLTEKTTIPGLNLTIKKALEICEDEGKVEAMGTHLWEPFSNR